jgi:hypothetical protein
MYVNGKTRPTETIAGMGGRRIKENGEGVNSSMRYLIHCRDFCKYHNVPSPSITIKKTRMKVLIINRNGRSKSPGIYVLPSSSSNVSFILKSY